MSTSDTPNKMSRLENSRLEASPRETSIGALPDAEWRKRFRRRLRSWYRQHGRDLPWRQTRDLYSIWVSEIMLQQTQVATVIPYYERFLQALPTVSDLAAASEQQVLRLWEGLGYYRRARQLHAAARVIVEQHAGQFPTSTEQVAQLPGIGRYTVGAILSFGLDRRLPILEANTVRLYARLLQLANDPTRSASQRLLWSFAEEVLPQQQVGEFNQAMMELGATVCTPKSPRCLICPVMSLCPTFAAGLQQQIPAAKRKMKYEDVNETAVVIQHRGKVLVRCCQPGERWAGLWDFPRFGMSGESVDRNANRELGGLAETEIVTRVRQSTGLSITLGKQLTQIKHGVTRFRITLDCFVARKTAGRLTAGPKQFQWLAPRALGELPLSVTGRQIADLLS